MDGKSGHDEVKYFAVVDDDALALAILIGIVSVVVVDWGGAPLLCSANASPATIIPAITRLELLTIIAHKIYIKGTKEST